MDTYEDFYDHCDDGPDFVDEYQFNEIKLYYEKFGERANELILKCLNESRELYYHKQYGPSIIRAVTAFELFIKKLVIDPILHGAFLYEYWGDEILEKLIQRNISSRDRDLLKIILRALGKDISNISTDFHGNLWNTLTSIVIKKRNDYVHKGEDVSKTEAKKGYESVVLFIDIVAKVIRKYDFNVITPVKYLGEK